jgi:hypothetical protein
MFLICMPKLDFRHTDRLKTAVGIEFMYLTSVFLLQNRSFIYILFV